MTKYILLILAATGVGCSDDGPGGGTGGSSGFGGSGGVDCQALQLACEGLDESECETRPGCRREEGALWEGDLDACLEEPREFVTCVAGEGCTGGFTAQGCIFHPSEPERLYCQNEIAQIPGWECVVECLIPDGLCGMLDDGVFGTKASRDRSP